MLVYLMRPARTDWCGMVMHPLLRHLFHGGGCHMESTELSGQCGGIQRADHSSNTRSFVRMMLGSVRRSATDVDCAIVLVASTFQKPLHRKYPSSRNILASHPQRQPAAGLLFFALPSTKYIPCRHVFWADVNHTPPILLQATAPVQALWEKTIMCASAIANRTHLRCRWCIREV